MHFDLLYTTAYSLGSTSTDGSRDFEGGPEGVCLHMGFLILPLPYRHQWRTES